jgi:tRNA-2-methylthio-N6-dimethylallyladenosine synthase
MDAVAELPKAMPHFEVPIQAGDDTVLENMKRGYTQADYYRLVEKIREKVPAARSPPTSSSASPARPKNSSCRPTRLSDLRLDVAHLARYSPREGTVSARRMEDDVPPKRKCAASACWKSCRKQIVGEINTKYLGETVEVLFEEKVKGRWKGRTPTNKLVFVESEENLRGRVIPVHVTWTGPVVDAGHAGQPAGDRHRRRIAVLPAAQPG